MADTKISALSSGTAAQSTDRLPASRSGANVHLTPLMLREFSAFTPVYVSGRWYLPDTRSPGTFTGLAFSVASTLRLVPGIISRTVSVTALGAVVTTGEAGKNIQLGIYNASATTARPTTLVAKTASMTIDAAGAKSASITGGPVTLNPGLYWFAANSDSTLVVCNCATSGEVTGPTLIGSTTLANLLTASASLTGFTTVDTFGTWTADITSNSFTELTSSRRAAVAFQVT